jgi:DNA-binding MarR family transcriptional regulator
LTILFLLAARSTVEEVHTRLAAAGFDGLRPAHGFAFQRLAPDGATGTELAEHLGITKQAASVMIDYLEERGYVARHPDLSDGRGKVVVLAARGWACIRAAERIFADVERRWTQTLGAAEMARPRADLRHLIAAEGLAGPPLRLYPTW